MTSTGNSPNIPPIITVEDVSKTYRAGRGDKKGRTQTALKNVSLTIKPQSFSALMGASGSGKTTLLNLIGGLDAPDSGSIHVDGSAMHSLSDDERSKVRLEKIGFVFQFFNLLPNISARANIELPLRLLGRSAGEAKEATERAVERVGLADKIDRMPYELSGGEMQRMAIARAIAHRPSLILADEPTGNLDSKTGTIVLEFMRELVEEDGLTILMATHDHRAPDYVHRVIEIRDGELAQPDKGVESHTSVEPIAVSV